VNRIREGLAGVALAAVVAVGACAYDAPSPGPARIRAAVTEAAVARPHARLADVDATSDRHQAGRVSGDATQGGASPAANSDCESESADPRTSCYRYRPVTLASR